MPCLVILLENLPHGHGIYNRIGNQVFALPYQPPVALVTLVGEPHGVFLES
jgi:hypothetical protein